jgi:hypothetical protein
MREPRPFPRTRGKNDAADEQTRIAVSACVGASEYPRCR